MIAELCFTCRRDHALAVATDRPREGVRRIWVVDTPDTGLVPPAGVELWVVPFERPGNLNGWGCLAGMLDCFDRAFREGATAVIKRDSDTAILDTAAFVAFAGEVFAVGVHQKGPTSQPWHLFGCCYGIAPQIMPLLRHHLDRRDWPTRLPREDETFSWWLRFHSRHHDWTAIRFTRNKRDTPGAKLAENRGNLWELDSVGNFASPPRACIR